MMINKAAFESYPQDVQDAIVKAEQEARAWERDFSKKSDEELVDKIKATGVTITEVDKAEWQEFCQPIYDQFKSEINPEYIDALLGK